MNMCTAWNCNVESDVFIYILRNARISNKMEVSC